MAIKKTIHSRYSANTSRPAARRSVAAGTAARRSVAASTSITSGIRNRKAPMARQSRVVASTMNQLTDAQKSFVRQLQRNHRSIMGATNTSNIAAKPEFVELLPLFVQKLLVLDVFGSVAMKSRQQIIPYFKVVAENTKGVTNKGDMLSSPFVNRQGIDPNFTSRIVRGEAVVANTLAYRPIMPGTVVLAVTASGTTTEYFDNGAGGFVDASGTAAAGTINYATGVIGSITGTISATYQYDNEFVGPNEAGNYGASMGKFYLDQTEINLVAKAHEIASYHSVYAAFAAQQEYGANIADMAKSAAFSQLTAEINETAFGMLAAAAQYKPQFDWDASPVLSNAVVPSDYLNMFKLKLRQASDAVYQVTRLSKPNRIVAGTNVGSYITMINGFQPAPADDNVGPYKLGSLEEFEIFVNPNYDSNTWVMCCKSDDIQRNSALFGEYMPFTETPSIGLADMSVQQGYCTMYAAEVVNPSTVVSGKILGTY